MGRERTSAWLAGGIVLAVVGACADERPAVATSWAAALPAVNVPLRGQGPAPNPVFGGERRGSTIQLARIGSASVALVADADGRALRVLDANDEPLSHYEAKMAKKNKQLAREGHTRMCRDELIAIRLYSGPM